FAGRAARDGADDPLHDVLDLAVHDHRIQALLAAEVLVHDGLRDAGTLGDLLDRGRLVAALGEDQPADVDELGPAGRGRETRASSSWGAARHGGLLSYAHVR